MFGKVGAWVDGEVLLRDASLKVDPENRRRLDLVAWGLHETPEVSRWLSVYDLTSEALQGPRASQTCDPPRISKSRRHTIEEGYIRP